MTTPAGWYDDGSGRQRWWGGEMWTEHYAPDEDPAVTTEGSANADMPTLSGAESQAAEPKATEPDVVPPVHTDASAPETSTGASPAPQPFGAQSTPSLGESPQTAAASSLPSVDWSSPPPPPQDWSAPPAPLEDTTPAIPRPAEPVIPAPVPPFTPAPQGYGPGGFAYTDPSAYGSAGYAPAGYGVAANDPPAPLSVLGLVGLGLSVIGVILAVIPPTWGFSWLLLGAGFLVSLISLFFKARKWPGVTGLIIAVVGFIVAVVMLFVLIFSETRDAFETLDPGSSDSGGSDSSSAPDEIDGSVMTSTLDLAVGDCMPYVDYGDTAPAEVPVVSCDVPHAEEVYYLVPFSGDAYPGESQVTAQSTEQCLAHFETFVGLPYENSTLEYYFYYPTEASWTNESDRVSTCVVYSSTDVTGTLQGAGY